MLNPKRKAMKTLVAFLMIMFVCLSGSYAQDAAKKKTFMVTTNHTPEQCLKALDEIKDTKSNLLEQTYFGCKHGDHTSYAFMHGTSEADVRAKLPVDMQKTATVKGVDRITAKEIEEFHKK